MKGLMAHSGSTVVDLEDVRSVPTPAPTKTHFPVPHSTVIDFVHQAFEGSGYTVTEEEYALRDGGDKGSIPGAQLFGLMHLRNGHDNPDYGLVVGFRNSHDKSIRAGIALGSNVFVCDNMAFCGEIVFNRMHTLHIMDDLPGIIVHAVGKLGVLRRNQDLRINAYKERNLTDNEAYAGIVHAMKDGIIPTSKITKVVEEWDNKGSRHQEFMPRNAWSLFNAFTEVLKDYPLDGAGHDGYQKRTERLHALMDRACATQINALRKATLN
jgi:hypothetical protein